MDDDSFYNGNENVSNDFIDDNELNILQKQKFDDRSETRVNLSLKSYLNSSFDSSSMIDSVEESLYDDNLFEWSTTNKIDKIINSSDFESKYGHVLIVNPSSIYIALGTSKGFVIGFNYHQEIEFILCSKESIGSESPIACMTFSSDSTFMATANDIGQIIIWNLSSKSLHLDHWIIEPHFVINPVTLEQRFNENKNGHLINDRINSIKFIGYSNLQLISSNTSGLIFYHHGFRKFVKNYFITQKILGNNDSNANNIKYLIQDMEVLPLSSDYSITDDLGIFSVLTSTSLIIMSLLSLNNQSNINLKTHFVTGKSKIVDSNMKQNTGCINWFPSLKKDNVINNALLAYSWNNVMTIVELDKMTFPDNFRKVISEARDKDKVLPRFIINKTCRWIAKGDFNVIIGIKWLSPEILTVFTKQDSEKKEVKIVLLHYMKSKKGIYSLVEIGNDKLNNLEMIYKSRRSTISNTESVESQFYNTTINCVKMRIILLVKSHNMISLNIGKAFTWADRLSNLLTKEEYSKALMSAYSFYITDNLGQIVLTGLPKKKEERIKLIIPILLKIMSKSISKLLESSNTDKVPLLKFYFEVIATLYNDVYREKLTTLLDELFETLDHRSIFFEQLEPYILSGRISDLSPIILQKLVEYYVQEKDGHKLTELICLLDMKSLDVDLTVQLCNKYKLRDCLIYIWNHVLGDYGTPLADFLRDISNNHDLEECLKVFPYLSFILSGRQYPTDRFIDSEKERIARAEITKIIFSSNSIHFENESPVEIIFPYLFILLKFNSFEMLSTLNEFFEESFLNESKSMNRQFILEALLDIFAANEFSEYDHCQLSIFIARNFPKYPQFIRLPESVLNNVIDHLCRAKDKKIIPDCELAMQSLLSVYEPDNFTYLLERLKAADFYNVLLNIYRSEGKYSKVVEIWLKKKREDMGSKYDTLEVILESSFLQVKTTVERVNLINIVKENFSSFIEFDVEKFYTIVSRYAPELHQEVLEIDNPYLRYKYLNLYFNNQNKNTILTRTEKLSELVGAFAQVLIKFSLNELPSFLKDYSSELSKNESECNKCLELFKSENLAACYTVIFIQLERYDEALKSLLDYLGSLAEILDNSMDGEVQKCAQLAMEVCELSEKDDEYQEQSLNFSETLWLELIKCLIELSNRDEPFESHHVLINKCIHDCFIKISELKLNHKNKNKQSFLKIFNAFLNDAAYDAATLSNVKDILQDVFISYSYESEMLQISFKMLNESIYKSMELIRTENLKGWSIKSKFCASCGKIMWGNNIHSSHFSAWEDRQKNLLLVRSGDDNIKLLDNQACTLVFFKCDHCYHLTCLENLGYHKVKECAICS